MIASSFSVVPSTEGFSYDRANEVLGHFVDGCRTVLHFFPVMKDGVSSGRREASRTLE